MAASACSQEDYSSTRCHRLPARPQRSSLNGNTQHKHTYTSLWMSPCRILVSISPVSSPPSFFHPTFYCPFSLPLSFIPPLSPACSPPPFSHSLFLSLFLSHFLCSPFRAEARPQTGNICSYLQAACVGLFTISCMEEDI